MLDPDLLERVNQDIRHGVRHCWLLGESYLRIIKYLPSQSERISAPSNGAGPPSGVEHPARPQRPGTNTGKWMLGPPDTRPRRLRDLVVPPGKRLSDAVARIAPPSNRG